MKLDSVWINKVNDLYEIKNNKNLVANERLVSG